jgi:hypothetical protein
MAFVTVYGVIQLKEGPYLILVTKASLIGNIMQRQIFQAEVFEFFPLSRASND